MNELCQISPTLHCEGNLIQFTTLNPCNISVGYPNPHFTDERAEPLQSTEKQECELSYSSTEPLKRALIFWLLPNLKIAVASEHSNSLHTEGSSLCGQRNCGQAWHHNYTRLITLESCDTWEEAYSTVLPCLPNILSL